MRMVNQHLPVKYSSMIIKFSNQFYYCHKNYKLIEKTRNVLLLNAVRGLVHRNTTQYIMHKQEIYLVESAFAHNKILTKAFTKNRHVVTVD